MDFNEIMKQAFPDGMNADFGPVVQNGDDECPMGDKCAIHFRLQERHMDEVSKYGRYIDYIGEYAVVTDLNEVPSGLDLLDAVQALRAAMLGDKEAVHDLLGDHYQTTVEYVGSGALADIGQVTMQEYEDKILRYKQTFDNFSEFETNHAQVVQLVTDGMLDLGEK